MTPLIMIRHGPTLWNEEKRLQGHKDIHLSDEGRRLVSSWQVPTPFNSYQWVCSPLHRARETAELLGARELLVEPRLKEMNYGNWEGCRLGDLRKELGEVMAENEARGLDFQPEGGDRPSDVQGRLVSWLSDVARNGRPTLAVSHHGVLRALFSLATGWNMVGNPPEKFQWGAMHCFQVADDSQVSVERLNISIAPK
jgi:broad specificity phosphatase PhoE